MTAGLNDLPEGTVVQIGRRSAVVRDDGKVSAYFADGNPWRTEEPIARVFVPVPEGMTYTDAEAALADAGAWVEVPTVEGVRLGARVRVDRLLGSHSGDWRRYVHRDDLPPADPDRELVEKMARAMAKGDGVVYNQSQPEPIYMNAARAALAVVREHEAKS